MMVVLLMVVGLLMVSKWWWLWNCAPEQVAWCDGRYACYSMPCFKSN